MVAEGAPFPTVQISIEKPIGQPRSMIRAEHQSDSVRWFDEKITTDHSLAYELNLLWPNGLRLEYRTQRLRSEHSGETKQEVCLVGQCFWIADSLIKGLQDNDNILVELDNHEIWVSKDYAFDIFSDTTISPQIGANILPAKITVSGTDGAERFQSILPIPFIGLGVRSNFIGGSNLFGQIHYFSYQHEKWGIDYQQHQIGVEQPINRELSVVIGYSHYRFNANYSKHSVDAEVKLQLDRPFIRVSMQF